MDTSAIFFWKIRDHLFKTVFPKFFCLFCNLNSKMSRNICKWRQKLRNGPILPPWSPNIWNYVFLSIFMDHLSNFSPIWDHIIKTVFSTQFVMFSIPISRISRNMCKWRQKLQNIKKSVGPPFTWWNEAWYMSNVLLTALLRLKTCLFLSVQLNIAWSPSRVAPYLVEDNVSLWISLHTGKILSTWHVTCDIWHMTNDMWHLTCDTWWGMNILLKFQLPSFDGLGWTLTLLFE